MKLAEIKRRLALWLCPELAEGGADEVSVGQNVRLSPAAKQLLNLADSYGAHLGISHWRVSFLVRGNGQFFKGLGEGKSCTLKTAAAALQWFSDNWPEDLAWPDGIARPQPAKRAA